MKKILTDAAAIGSVTARALTAYPRLPVFYLYPGERVWTNPFLDGRFNFLYEIAQEGGSLPSGDEVRGEDIQFLFGVTKVGMELRGHVICGIGSVGEDLFRLVLNDMGGAPLELHIFTR